MIRADPRGLRAVFVAGAILGAIAGAILGWRARRAPAEAEWPGLAEHLPE